MIAISEKDWRVFRALREQALERFLGRVLDEAGRISTGLSGSAQERYQHLYRFIQDRDRELASAFDEPRRSNAIAQIVALVHLGLLSPEELERFSEEVRKIVDRVRQ
jgi:hypothetical protein